MRKLILCCTVLLICIAATPAMADVILAPGSTWEYTFTEPIGLSWTTTTGGWVTGLAPFGNNTGGYGSVDPTGLFDYATYWAADNSGSLDYDLWVRTTFDLTGFDLSSILWDLGVDNGFALYLNGNLIAEINAEGYTWRWEYSGDFGSYLNPGVNYIAVALEDHGGLTAFDMQVTGTPVPEPITLLLLGTGLGTLGLVAYRRRKK